MKTEKKPTHTPYPCPSVFSAVNYGTYWRVGTVDQAYADLPSEAAARRLAERMNQAYLLGRNDALGGR